MKKAALLFLLFIFKLLPATADEVTGANRVDFVYLGANDCPPCVAWRTWNLPILKEKPVFQKIRFTHVIKTIGSPVPSAFWFPEEIKHLRAPIAESIKGAGSPMFAILANGVVVASWKGVRKNEDEIANILADALQIKKSS